MELSHILILLATGIFTGFAGGMLGVGGAFIMTPLQYIVYTDLGLPDDLALLTAFATSLLVILPVSLSGAWRHYRQKSVQWRAAIVMGLVSLAVAYGGATLATHLSATLLKVAFGILIILAGIRMLLGGEPKYKIEAVSRPWLWALWALPVGFLSGVFGIGGGVLLVPVLVLALRFEIHYAIGTSLAVIIFTSVGGALGYIVNGLGVPGRLDYSVGYVNLPSWLLLAVPAVFMAQVGAVTAHKLPRRPLLYTFVIILFYMGLRTAGLFDWLGWPL